jgi:hypothetical protein
LFVSSMAVVSWICIHSNNKGYCDANNNNLQQCTDIVDVRVDGVRLCLWTAATNGPVVHGLDNMSMENHGGMILTGKSEELEEKPVPVPRCSPQIPRGLTGTRSRSSTVTDRLLTTWAIAYQTRLLISWFVRFAVLLQTVNDWDSLDWS